jgi:DNA-binding CsgD family transcriptional regulator
VESRRRAILGQRRRRFSGQPCWEVLAGQDEHENRLCYPTCRTRALVQCGEPVRAYDMRTTTKAGEPVCLNFSILPLPPVTLHLFRDVTAERRLLRVILARLDADTAAPPCTGPTSKETLTQREIEVLKLLGEGMGTSAIARRLSRSQATVRNHAQSILRKLKVHSRLEASAVAARHGWL